MGAIDKIFTHATSESNDGARHRSRSRRRRCSKFAIQKYTKDEKCAKKLTAIELIYVVLLWVMQCRKHVDMGVDDILRYMGHMAFMILHATSGTYMDLCCVIVNCAMQKTCGHGG